MAVQAEKPLPRQSTLAEPYWEALKQGRYLIQRCAACGKARHYPRLVCSACHSLEFEWIEASGHGVVHSWTVCHHAYHPGFARDLPYTLLTVDLAEGVRALGRLRRGGGEPVAIGTPVSIGYEQARDGVVLPVFDLVAAQPGVSS